MYKIDMTKMPYTTDSGKVKQTPQKWTHQGWRAPANILVIMLSGECTFIMPEENRSVRVHAGQSLLILQNVFYRGTCQTDCEYYFFHFYNPVTSENPQTVRKQLDEAYQYTEQHNPNHYFRHIPTLFDQVYLYEVTGIMPVQKKINSLLAECDNEVRKKDINRMIRISTLLARILTLISEAAMNTFPASVNSAEYPASLNRILEYIDENYTQKITLEMLADMFLLSKQHIGRLFRTYLNTTVTHYVNDLKLSHAPELLCQTVLNINEIAQYLGYSNTNYFSRLFKDKYSVCPSEFKPTQRVKYGSNISSYNNEKKDAE